MDGRNNDNPDGFLEGDKLARYLASQRNSRILLVEKDAQDEIKVEVESPPSSPPPPPSSLDIEMAPTPTDDDENENVEKEYTIKIKVKSKKKASEPIEPKQTPTPKSLEQPDKKIKKPKHKFVLCHCPHCGKEFHKRKCLNDHVRYVHLKDFRIKCPICDKGFTLNRHRTIHLLIHHKEDPVTLKLTEEKGITFKMCSMANCRAMFLTREEEDKHMENKHGGDDKVGETLKDRKSKVSGDGKVLCCECGKWYSNWLWWTNHYWKVHEGRDLNCPGEECGMVFKVASGTMKKFRAHFEMRHEKKKIICNICGEGKINMWNW